MSTFEHNTWYQSNASSLHTTCQIRRHSSHQSHSLYAAPPSSLTGRAFFQIGVISLLCLTTHVEWRRRHWLNAAAPTQSGSTRSSGFLALLGLSLLSGLSRSRQAQRFGFPFDDSWPLRLPLPSFHSTCHYRFTSLGLPHRVPRRLLIAPICLREALAGLLPPSALSAETFIFFGAAAAVSFDIFLVPLVRRPCQDAIGASFLPLPSDSLSESFLPARPSDPSGSDSGSPYGA